MIGTPVLRSSEENAHSRATVQRQSGQKDTTAIGQCQKACISVAGRYRVPGRQPSTWALANSPRSLFEESPKAEGVILAQSIRPAGRATIAAQEVFEASRSNSCFRILPDDAQSRKEFPVPDKRSYRNVAQTSAEQKASFREEDLSGLIFPCFSVVR